MKNDRNHGKGDSGERRRKALGCFPIPSNPLRKSGAQAGQGVFYFWCIQYIHFTVTNLSTVCELKPIKAIYIQQIENLDFSSCISWTLYGRDRNLVPIWEVSQVYLISICPPSAPTKTDQLVGLQPRPKFTFSLTRWSYIFRWWDQISVEIITIKKCPFHLQRLWG